MDITEHTIYFLDVSVISRPSSVGFLVRFGVMFLLVVSSIVSR